MNKTELILRDKLYPLFYFSCNTAECRTTPEVNYAADISVHSLS